MVNKRRWILLPALLALALLSACTGTAEEQGAVQTAQAVVPATGQELDQLFIDMMVPHHQSAVEMARIAQQRAEHPEIQEMAANIISSQEEEIQQLTGYRQEWYGSGETPSMEAMPMLSGMPGMEGEVQTMNMQAEVEALSSAAEPFDLAFIDAMIGHHTTAVEAARLVQDTAARQETRDMAMQIIAEQQQEIDQLLNWRSEWYPEAPAISQ